MKKTREPPYADGTKVVKMVNTEPMEFLRFHGPHNALRPWLVQVQDVVGLSAEEVAAKYNLSFVPTHISKVRVPPGAVIKMSLAAPGAQAVQFEVAEPIGNVRRNKLCIPRDWFSQSKEFEIVQDNL